MYNKTVSILIPAYKAEDFIEECLTSIINQKNLSEYSYEILVGVDGCEETKDKLLEIKSNYKFLKCFLFEKNVGAYIVRNTLAYESRNTNLIFFDVDDIMCDTLVHDVVGALKYNSIVRFMYYNFGEGKWAGRRSKEPASGVFGINVSAFKDLGGFADFRVSSDDDFRHRALMLGYKTCNIMDKDLFLRRRHNKSLTGNILTTQGSDYRKIIYKKIDDMHRLGIKRVDPVFEKCVLL